MTTINAMRTEMASRDLQRTIDYYRDVLGFALEDTWPNADEPAWCSLTLGAATLMFSKGWDGEPMFTGRLYLYPDDITAYWARVKDSADIAHKLVVTEYGMREFSVRDPDGYILSFGEPTDEPAEPHDHADDEDAH